MKLAISFAFLMLSLFCKGQSNEFFGLWIGTAEYRVENIASGEIYDDFEDFILFNEDGKIDSVAWNQQQKVDSIKWAALVPKAFPAKMDTNFSPVHVILELRENGTAVYKEFGESEQNLNWFPANSPNEIRLELEDTLILRLDSTKHLSLVFYERDSLQRKLLFEPLSKSSLTPNLDIGSMLKKNSWKFSKTDGSNEPSSTLYFENDTLTISVFNTETETYCTPGNWIIDEFAGHYFLIVRNSYFPFCLHLTDIQLVNSPSFLTDFYTLSGFPFETEYPNLVNYNLTGSELPKQRTLAETSKKLIGIWESIDTAFPVDHTCRNQKILSSFLTYQFSDDGTVNLNYGGEVKDDYGTVRINKKVTINWSISTDGSLIIFDRAYSSQNIAFIKFINSDTIEVRKGMESLKGHLVDNMIFKMKRISN